MQTDAGKPLTRVATYERTVGASSDRVWENVHDWEHLPWLHSGSFSSIECTESGPWGWRARVGLQPAAAGREILLELVLEPSGDRYVSRVLEGDGARSEIWTSVEPRDESHTAIRVEFWLPDVDPEHASALGQAYTSLYTRLWDEDEGMMVRRALELDARPRTRPGAGEGRLDLGPLEALRARLPLCVGLRGRRYVVREVDGELVAHASRCPHLLGPLELGEVEDGVVTCPWHGYRFDVRSGESRDGRRLRLDRAPEISVGTDSRVLVSI